VVVVCLVGSGWCVLTCQHSCGHSKFGWVLVVFCLLVWYFNMLLYLCLIRCFVPHHEWVLGVCVYILLFLLWWFRRSKVVWWVCVLVFCELYLYSGV
jgi:hypothetical protein